MVTTRKRKYTGKANKRDPEETKADIIRAATEEFAARGLKGARIDAVAKRTRSTRAMIYYYFKSKEGLYLAVIEGAYSQIREAEKKLDLGHLHPEEAMRQLVAFTFDYYQANPAFVALVVAENQSGGEFIRKVNTMHHINESIIDTLSQVLHAGALVGAFRTGIDAVNVHMVISSLGWFQVANRHTFGYLFDRNMTSRQHVHKARALITEIVLRYLAPATAGDAMQNSGLPATSNQ